ncbi:MAG: hypothetical protein HPAVJP_5620 [Candidatus Hepatoplasma vulgare]|nr:MAG: hypothetical protein HPAVJP_5620 [Candidatus Hepatoplasma sp.]
MKKFNIKNFIWFLIFLGLSFLFIYIASNIMYKINRPIGFELTNLEIVFLKILFTSIIFFDFGFFIASFWNLYICIKSILKKEENK